MTRTTAYKFTVRMVDGNIHPEDQPCVDSLRNYVKLRNSTFNTKHYVKLQGRLGESNVNAQKYRRGGKYGSHQAIRLPDAQTADVYVYDRKSWW